MKTVTVHVADLLETLKMNLKTHYAQFLEAHEGWKAKCVEKLEKALVEAKAGKKFETSFHLPEPRSYVDDYNRAIKMAEWEVEKVVELDREDFTQLILDEWHWKEHFLSNSSMYSTSEWTQSRNA